MHTTNGYPQDGDVIEFDLDDTRTTAIVLMSTPEALVIDLAEQDDAAVVRLADLPGLRVLPAPIAFWDGDNARRRLSAVLTAA